MQMSKEEYPADWEAIRKRIYERDGYRCQTCGRYGGRYGNAELHAHHVGPKSQGGTPNIADFLTVCHSCHDRLHDHHIPKSGASCGIPETTASAYTRSSHGSGNGDEQFSLFWALVVWCLIILAIALVIGAL